MKNIFKISIATAILLMLHSSAFAEWEELTGLTIDAGPTYSSNKKYGTTVDVNIIAFILNGSIEKTWWDENKAKNVRGYIGVGWGSALQLQGGLGERGGTLRLRSSWAFRSLYDKNLPTPYPKNQYRGNHDHPKTLLNFVIYEYKPRLDPIFSPYLEINNNETRTGINIGILF